MIQIYQKHRFEFSRFDRLSEFLSKFIEKKL